MKTTQRSISVKSASIGTKKKSGRRNAKCGLKSTTAAILI